MTMEMIGLRFTKMQGIGNDYIYVNGFEETVKEPDKLAMRMSNRHFGVGSDGLVLILPCEEADFRMRMFNSDGSESEMCGNATRCIAKYVYERGLTDKTDVDLLTGAGHIRLALNVQDGRVRSVRVDMGRPILTPERVPVALPGDAVILDHPLTVDGQTYAVCCVSMGNPHCVIFIDHDPADLRLEEIGPKIEHHPLFPRLTNVEFVQVLSPAHMKMRVWERGAGETLACGTGACAVQVAAALTGRTGRETDIDLVGGTLHVTWAEDDHVYQEGPAAFVFDGVWPDEA